MFHFKITTSSNMIYEGLAVKKEDLMFLINNKVETNKFTGTVEIFDGKKKIEEYKV